MMKLKEVIMRDSILDFILLIIFMFITQLGIVFWVVNEALLVVAS